MLKIVLLFKYAYHDIHSDTCLQHLEIGGRGNNVAPADSAVNTRAVVVRKNLDRVLQATLS